MSAQRKRELAPLVFLVSVLFFLGGIAGFFGPNWRMGAIYFALGSVGILYSAKEAWRP